MISTEQEARAAVARVGIDALRVVNLISTRFFNCVACPASITVVAQIYGEQGHPKKYARLHRIATEWAAARGAAK